MKNQKSTQFSDHHCTVLEQKHLVSEMTRCDKINQSHSDRYECYLDATKESRVNKSCMFS